MTDPIDVTKLLVELSRGLDQAFEPAVQSDAYKREQLAAALMVVARFLAKTIGRAPASEIFDLGSAIANLNSGAVHPLLGPPTDIPRRDPSQTWRARVDAVLAVDALHVTGSPLPFAARDVLRMIKRHTGREPGMSVEMLLNWRKEVSAGRIKNAEARELLDVGRELIQARRSDTRALRQIAVRRAEAAGKADGVFAPPPNTPRPWRGRLDRGARNDAPAGPAAEPGQRRITDAPPRQWHRRCPAGAVTGRQRSWPGRSTGSAARSNPSLS
jgi:hypothetical protein